MTYDLERAAKAAVEMWDPGYWTDELEEEDRETARKSIARALMALRDLSPAVLDAMAKVMWATDRDWRGKDYQTWEEHSQEFRDAWGYDALAAHRAMIDAVTGGAK